MDSPRMEVKCSVDSCNYWKDNYCHAKSLKVDPMENRNAHTSDDTCCTTFRPME